MVIRHVGKRRIPLFGKMIGPGETRGINPQQWVLVEAQYPGEFEQVGGPPPLSLLRQAQDKLPQGGEVRLWEEEGELVTGLEQLGLSLRAVETLMGAGVTAAGLGEMSDEELLAISGIGPGTLREIRSALVALRQTQDEGDDDDATE